MEFTRQVRAWWAGFATWRTRSRFGRNLWQVTRANVLAQALLLLAAPLLTRLYAPESFGSLALFTSLLGLGLALGTARFEWSVPNARSGAMAAALLACGAGVLLLASAAAAVAWWAWGACWAAPGSALRAAGGLLPLALLGAGLQQLLSAWHVRGAELAPVGRAKVHASLANVGVALAASVLGGVGLLAAALAGAWIGLGTLWRRARGLRPCLRRLRRRHLALAVRHFGGEAAWSTLASLLNTVSFAAIPLLLARHYSAAEVGYYALMQRVALGPVGFVGAAITQSFWAEAARLVHTQPEALEQLFRRSTRRMLWLALPLALLALAGPLYIGPIFGSAQWQPAGWVVAASAPMLLGQAVVSPLSHLIVHRKQHWQVAWDAARTLALLAIIETLGRQAAPFAFTVLAASLLIAAMYGLLYFMNLAALKRRIAQAGTP
jgi:O-antigen/teichoic acid export membrane protein